MVVIIGEVEECPNNKMICMDLLEPLAIIIKMISMLSEAHQEEEVLDSLEAITEEMLILEACFESHLLS